MNPEVADFQAECRSIATLFDGLPAEAFTLPTRFKGWTTEEILLHLLSGNRAAVLSLQDPEAFKEMFRQRMANRARGVSNAEIDRQGVGNATGADLVAIWMQSVDEMVEAFGEIDLSQRVPWAKSMSARSSVSARLMENWAHAQAIYDLLGEDRVATDRIRSIVILGVNTYGWTFETQGVPAPGPRPLVALTAPSGADWTFPGEEETTDSIRGSAFEFCQVVTQVRNIADTSLEVQGPAAQAWMASAQCFAGAAHPPPAPGSRRKEARRPI